MLKKRIIPCLDIKNGRTVKGVQFGRLRDAGDPVQLAKSYAEQGADELVFLDISATAEGRSAFRPLVERIAREIDIPFTVGGGIKDPADALRLLHAGADKISVNSAAVRNPALINALAQSIGSQAVTVAIDSKHRESEGWVYIQGGALATDWQTLAWAKEAEQRGAGEILLTSMDQDGEQQGFDLALTEKISTAIALPVIASGGGGQVDHFRAVFQETRATGALAASIFHYQSLPIPQLKQALQQLAIPIR